MDEAQVRRRLREAAGAHQPDRARILARVERGIANPARAAEARRRPRALWTTAAAVAAAVVGVLSLGGLAATTLNPDADPGRVATMPAAPPPVGAAGTVDPGSNRWWAQSNVTLTAPAPLTALTVELRIARTAGVSSTGHWRTPPADDFTVSVRQEATALVYTWVLKPGRTVPAGRHVFAGQYNHAEGGRDAGSDTYTVTSAGDSHARAVTRGGFAPGAARR
ncbi:hypothetical protein [Streptomyces sp. NPDC053755]|uniref:hypothetical protein n=1 Tax=Streptomyces sp. NPDC053755 TaxID=3155815 RepID=UPI00343C714B